MQIRSDSAHSPVFEKCGPSGAGGLRAVAAANLHTELLPGKVVMMGCP
ncbi:MAG: hypothetical protein R2861_12525 [Desulfobacterales bacterium]